MLHFISIDGKFHYEVRLPTGWEDSTIRFSTDLTKILFARHLFELVPGQTSLGSLAVIDLEKQTFQSFKDVDNCFNGSWSPAGDRLVTICNGDIWLVSLQTGKMTNLETYCQSSCGSVQWSLDGQRLVFSKGDIMRLKDSGVFILSLSCVDHPETCHEKLLGPVSHQYEPFLNAISLSPDGKALLTYEDWDSEKKVMMLELINIHTGQTIKKIEVLNTDKRQAFSLNWSPDGKWIAFDQSDGIYLVHPDGGLPQKLVDIHASYIYQWITIPRALTPGDSYSITNAGADLNLRNAPLLTSEVLKILQPGDSITTLGDFTYSNGYVWWRVREQDGIEGWAEDIPEWYAPQVTVTPSPTP